MMRAGVMWLKGKGRRRVAGSRGDDRAEPRLVASNGLAPPRHGVAPICQPTLRHFELMMASRAATSRGEGTVSVGSH